MIQAATEPSVEDLLRRHEGLVGRIVTQCAGVGHPSVDDFMQEGRIALWRAIERFDPSRGWKFSTFAWPVIRNAVWRAIHVDRLIRFGLPRACDSEEMQADKQRASKLVSLDEPTGDRSEPYHTTLPSEQPSDPERTTQRNEIRAWLQASMYLLKSRQQQVLRRRSQGMTLIDIGMMLGITRERVRQIEQRAIEKLRKVRPTSELP